MADAAKRVGKRGRPRISDSERKKRKLERKKSSEQSRIYLGSEITRWLEVKRMHNLQNDREVATFLIDRYKHSVHGDVVVPGTSEATQGPSRLTSTPGVGHDVHVVSTPSVPGVSELTDRELPMDVNISGVEEMASSGDSNIELQMSSKGKESATRPHVLKKLSSSFMDPAEISIDITQIDIEVDSEEEFGGEEDPDYEPSVLISNVLPRDLEEQCEDVAFEEAEFDFEKEVDEPTEDELPSEDTLPDGISQIKTTEDCSSVTQAFKCICFIEQLLHLAKMKCDRCSTCSSSEVEIVESFIGSAVYLKWICKEGHVSQRWCSQPPILNRRMHCGDFLICSTILTSGNNFSKMKLWSSMLHMKFPSANQFHGIQGKYLVPTIDSYWLEHQRNTLSTFQNDEIVVLGDGRNDSPGHCAQYCSYTVMEQESKKILTLKTMDKRVTERKSGNMEKSTFQAAMTELQEKGLTVKEVVTGAHMGIGAIMKSNYREVKHSHDIWHVAKNLGKKLSKITQRKGNAVLTQWDKDIVNHFWFTCKTAETYGQFVGIWSSVLHHVVNEHELILSHGGDGINQCLHGPLGDEAREKSWLNASTHRHILKDLANVILDKSLLKNVHYYLNFRSTADLEGFHQHILMYCAKRFSYTPPVYRVRNYLTALDHNMHIDRPDALNKDGTMRLQRVWNKKSGRWSVYPVKETKKYLYIDEMLKNALTLRLEDTVGIYKPRQLEADDPRRLSKHLAPVSPKATLDIFEEQKSRFK